MIRTTNRATAPDPLHFGAPGWHEGRMPDDRAARDLARRQHGVVGDRQADALGLGARHRMTRLRSGAWEKIGSRAYVLAGVPLTDRAMAMAAVLDVRGDAYLSHTSAAWLWGIPGFDLRPIHVARRYEGTRGRRGSLNHNLRGVPPDHLGEVDGIGRVAGADLFQVRRPPCRCSRTAVDNVLAMGRLPKAFHDLLRVLARGDATGSGSCAGYSRAAARLPTPSRATGPSSGCASATDTGAPPGGDRHRRPLRHPGRLQDVAYPTRVPDQSARWHESATPRRRPPGEGAGGTLRDRGHLGP